MGIVFHFLDKDLKVRNLLIRIKRVKRAKTKKNIIKIIIFIIERIISGIRLGFFIGDNISKNSIIIRAIFTHLYLDLEDSNFKYVKYLDYIMNFTAKIFLFSKDVDVFKEDSRTKKELFKFEAVRELWQKKGLVGKFYNTIYFIRKTL